MKMKRPIMNGPESSLEMTSTSKEQGCFQWDQTFFLTSQRVICLHSNKKVQEKFYFPLLISGNKIYRKLLKNVNSTMRHWGNSVWLQRKLRVDLRDQSNYMYQRAVILKRKQLKKRTLRYLSWSVGIPAKETSKPTVNNSKSIYRVKLV